MKSFLNNFIMTSLVDEDRKMKLRKLRFEMRQNDTAIKVKIEHVCKKYLSDEIEAQ
jgi:hypothetical protein